MFWAIMYMLFFSGSPAPELLVPDEVKFQNAIMDHQRLEKVLTIQNEVKIKEQALSENINNLYDSLALLSLQYDVEIKQLQDVFDEMDAARSEAKVLCLDKRFEM
jgi:hypothetical protein